MGEIRIKTRALIFTKSRGLIKKKIRADQDNFRWRKGLYLIEPSAINNWSVGDLIHGSEILFFEGNPSPVPILKPDDDDEDPSSRYLDEFIYKNVLEQTGNIKDPMFEGLFAALTPLKSPANFMLFIIFVLIAVSVVRGLLTGQI